MFNRLNAMRFLIVVATLLVTQSLPVPGTATHAMANTGEHEVGSTVDIHSTVIDHCPNHVIHSVRRVPIADQDQRNIDLVVNGRRMNEIVDAYSHVVGQFLVVPRVALHKRADCVIPQFRNRTCGIVRFEHSVAPMHETRGRPWVRSSLTCKSQDVRLTFMEHERPSHGLHFDIIESLGFKSFPAGGCSC